MKTLPVLLVLALSACGLPHSKKGQQDDAPGSWKGVSTRSQMCEVLHSDLASIYQGFDQTSEVNQSYLSGGSGVGNGGDPLRVIFERARGDAAKRIRAFKTCELPRDTADKVIDWLDMHRAELEQDVRNTQHVWLEKPQPTCARTLLARDMPITLSFEVCRAADVDRSVAAELLVHESVHHFGIEDETEADKIAHAVMTRGDGACDDDQDDGDANNGGDSDGDGDSGSSSGSGGQGGSSGSSGGSSAAAASSGGAAAACAGGGSAAAASGNGAAVACSGNGSAAASSGGAAAASSGGSAAAASSSPGTVAYFGSLAYSKATGKTGMSWLQPAIETAKIQAIASCDADDCGSVVWVRSGCAALVASESSLDSYKWGWAADRSTAISLATQACKEAFTSCKAPVSVCSG